MYNFQHTAKFEFSSVVTLCLPPRTVLLSFQVIGQDSAEPVFSSEELSFLPYKNKSLTQLWAGKFKFYCILPFCLLKQLSKSEVTSKKNQMILHKESGFIAEGAVLLNKSTCSESYQRSVPLISKQIDSALSRFAVSQR